MNLHKHARLSPRGRALLVDRILVHGLRLEEAAHAAGVSVRTAYKWLQRFRLGPFSEILIGGSTPTPCRTSVGQGHLEDRLPLQESRRRIARPHARRRLPGRPLRRHRSPLASAHECDGPSQR